MVLTQQLKARSMAVTAGGRGCQMMMAALVLVLLLMLGPGVHGEAFKSGEFWDPYRKQIIF